MRPVEFKEQTVIVAKDQPEYLQLPAYIGDSPLGEVISCWKLSWRERLKLLITGRIWVSLLCFHKPVTPSKLSVDKSDYF